MTEDADVYEIRYDFTGASEESCDAVLNTFPGSERLMLNLITTDTASLPDEVWDGGQPRRASYWEQAGSVGRDWISPAARLIVSRYPDTSPEVLQMFTIGINLFQRPYLPSGRRRSRYPSC